MEDHPGSTCLLFSINMFGLVNMFTNFVGYSMAKQPSKDRCTILILALQRGSFYTCWDNFALNFPFLDGQSNVQTCQNMSKHQKMGYPNPSDLSGCSSSMQNTNIYISQPLLDQPILSSVYIPCFPIIDAFSNMKHYITSMVNISLKAIAKSGLCWNLDLQSHR